MSTINIPNLPLNFIVMLFSGDGQAQTNSRLLTASKLQKQLHDSCYESQVDGPTAFFLFDIKWYTLSVLLAEEFPPRSATALPSRLHRNRCMQRYWLTCSCHLYSGFKTRSRASRWDPWRNAQRNCGTSAIQCSPARQWIAKRRRICFKCPIVSAVLNMRDLHLRMTQPSRACRDWEWRSVMAVMGDYSGTTIDSEMCCDEVHVCYATCMFQFCLCAS